MTMFWALNLQPNRKYSQTAKKPFHISSAALDITSSKGGPTQIFISTENEKYIICTLQKEGPLQVMLDLNFAQGEKICFKSVGNGNVSLSGYFHEDLDFGYGEEEDSSEAEEEITDLRQALNKKIGKKNAGKAKTVDEDDDSDSDDPDFNGIEADEDESDELGDEEGGSEEDDDDEDEDEVEEDDDDDDQEEEDESEVEDVKHTQPKRAKLENNESIPNGKASSKNQKEQNKKDQQKNQQNAKQQLNKKNEGGSPVGVEKTISGGVKVIDIREGNGPVAKTGARAQVYYEGRLKSNNKMFDSMRNGAGFKFALGRGEVIKGWDVGVVGMKVGGKRRIICPPHMAYGAKGSPPTIPPNSTLVFDVELKGVN